MSALTVTRLLVLLPVAGAVLALGLRRMPYLAAALATFLAWVSVAVAVGEMVLAPTRDAAGSAIGRSFHVGGLEVPLQLGSGPTTAAIAAVVAVVVAVVLVFTCWYLAEDDRLAQFAATVSLFTAAMMLVVHARDLILTLIGWEVMGWCSYLLIGHWSRKESARRAAYKAFMVTRIADIGFVLGIVGLSAGAGSTGLADVIAHWTGSGDQAPEPWMRSVLLSLVVIGVLGKSAQFPFQDWLPDAMEGPTPASALIHAATMVAAGTVVLAQLFPILVLADGARWLLGLAVAVTMVGAAVLALGQSDLKRLLAWSTVSQVAIMLSVLATATADLGPDAGLLHLWSHAIFKSLLFLTIGWLSVYAGSTLAVALRGTGQLHQLALVAWLFGLLALAGAPFVVGGLSKEHVIVTAYEGAINAGGPGILVLAALLVTVVLTAAYATRAYLVVAAHVEPPPDDAAAHDPTASAHSRMPSAPVLASIALLTVLTVAGGLITLTGLFDIHRASTWWLILTALLILIGGGVASLPRSYADPRDAFVRTRRQRELADRGLGFDTAYTRLVATPVLGLAKVVAFLDREVIDGYVRGAAASTGIIGWFTERSHRRESPSAGVGLVAAGLLVAAGTAVLTWR